ncbi:MAG: hypothetical protein JST30_00280 [Armatimonadetes bacterium]|nr:hypothetical protein [Armatimonadota bacterium]
MPIRRTNVFNLIRSPKWCFLLAAVTLTAGAYYGAAQTLDLPGAPRLRERWNDLTTRRGTRGHRVHRPRPTGPLDMSLCGLAFVALTWQGLSLRAKQRREHAL